MKGNSEKLTLTNFYFSSNDSSFSLESLNRLFFFLGNDDHALINHCKVCIGRLNEGNSVKLTITNIYTSCIKTTIGTLETYNRLFFFLGIWWPRAYQSTAKSASVHLLKEIQRNRTSLSGCVLNHTAYSQSYYFYGRALFHRRKWIMPRVGVVSSGRWWGISSDYVTSVIVPEAELL